MLMFGRIQAPRAAFPSGRRSSRATSSIPPPKMFQGKRNVGQHLKTIMNACIIEKRSVRLYSFAYRHKCRILS